MAFRVTSRIPFISSALSTSRSSPTYQAHLEGLGVDIVVTIKVVLAKLSVGE